jgi:hypothetical protein
VSVATRPFARPMRRCPSGPPAGSSAWILTPSAAGRTRAGSRHSRPPAATAASSRATGRADPPGPPPRCHPPARLSRRARPTGCPARTAAATRPARPWAACAMPSRPLTGRRSATDGRALVAALVAHLDADDEAGRDRAEGDAVEATDALAARVAAAGIPLPDAVSCSSPRASRSSRSSVRSPVGRSLDPDRLLRDLRAFVRSARSAAPPSRPEPPGGPGLMPAGLLPALTSILALVLSPRPARPVARTPPAVPADLGGSGCSSTGSPRAARRSPPRRLERDPVPDLVPDGRGLDGRLARPRDDLPPVPDAVRLHVRVLPASWPACSRC